MREHLAHLRDLAESDLIRMQCLAALAVLSAMAAVSYRKIGGIRFLKVGRVNASWSVSKKREG